MILSDRTLREKLDAGEIEIDPLGDNAIQPSSVDLRVDRYFRVFRNHTAGVIDVKQDMAGLTEPNDCSVRDRDSGQRTSSTIASPMYFHGRTISSRISLRTALMFSASVVERGQLLRRSASVAY